MADGEGVSVGATVAVDVRVDVRVGGRLGGGTVAVLRSTQKTFCLACLACLARACSPTAFQ